MKQIVIILLAVLTAWMPLNTLGNSPENPVEDEKGKVVGEVQDKNSKKPIEYATITIHNTDGDQLITGTISDAQGQFTLKDIKNGSYYISIKFIGYKEQILRDITVKGRNSSINIGNILLEEDSQAIDEIVVSTNRQKISYQIDKKVINVAEQITSASMSAVEVLENMPSIRVDIEGNVSLRGSTGFTVLIDGKPTVLDPSDVLKQTPASTIQNIEIITNPSVKYEPDGTGGIVNIVTKKNRTPGIQGLVNFNTGSFGRYGADFLLNYRKNNMNFFIGSEHRRSPYEGNSYNERRTTIDGTTTYNISEGESNRQRNGNDLRLGIEWDMSDNDNFSLEARGGRYESLYDSRLNYFTQQNDEIPFREISENESGRSANYISTNANYIHKFDEEKHELVAQLNFSYRDGDEHAENFRLDANEDVTGATRTTEVGPGKRWTMRLDYTKPFDNDNALETGFQLRKSTSIDETTFNIYDITNKEFVLQPDFSNKIDYDHNIYAVYGIYRGMFNNFGYQVGLRSEYTYREVTPTTSDEVFTIDRWDYFPTLHISFQFPKDHQLMTSYSRRIDRPRGWYLEPFITWSDMYNVRRGNPELDAEYIDALELSYVKNWEESQFSLETYYRIKHNKIERIRSVYDEGIVLSTYENIGKDYSLGMELMYSTPLFKWWEVSFTGNMFDYRIDGERNNVSYDMSSFTWSSRMANTFQVHQNWRLQLDGFYNSPTISTQSESRENYGVNLAVRADFLDRKLSTTLQARDLFSTMKYESTIEDDNLFSLRKYSNNAPLLSLTLSYRINNFKPKRQQRNGDNQNGGEEF
ncbi:TonB-dependent receptor [Puteibacter caeruleilacunae]|nr:TonB-dependent receptor [Puteibacter caeruleilacunae]